MECVGNQGNQAGTLGELGEVLEEMEAKIQLEFRCSKWTATVFDGWSDGIGCNADMTQAISSALFAFGVNKTLREYGAA